MSRTASGRTTVHLLRHGKVQNPGDILYGRLPGFYLAASGLAMADGIAEYLRGNDITFVGASPLQRAQQTAGPTSLAKGLSIVTDERLIEASNVFEGQKMSVGDGALRRPKNWGVLRDPFTPSWGEPFVEIAHRMLGAVYAAVDAADGHEALLVSHQLPIWTIRRYLLGQRLWHNPGRRQCSVASLTSLHFTNGVFTGFDYAEPVRHIPAVDDPVTVIQGSADGVLAAGVLADGVLADKVPVERIEEDEADEGPAA